MYRLCWLLLSLMVASCLGSCPMIDFSARQLPFYRDTHCNSKENLTTTAGVCADVSQMTTLNKNLVNNPYMMDLLSNFANQRTIRRVVHEKGSGAYGYFIVTDDITDICAADLFSEIGKKTPVWMRLSLTFGFAGSSETSFSTRGFAVKFYTREGNLDIPGFNTPMFPLRDPIKVVDSVNTNFYNPVTNLPDATMTWDYITRNPEALYLYIYLFAGYGYPENYRHMPGFSIHTHHVYNKKGESYFVRFHFLPVEGIKNMSEEDITRLAAEDPHCHTRDLYNHIASGKTAEWDVAVQVMTMEDVKNANLDIFDLTIILPKKDYPLKKVGKIILNKNPHNYNAEVEKIAFNPYNLVNGFLGAPDKIFEARRIAYKIALDYRLGNNHNNIEVNRPLTKVRNYYRDGVSPVLDNMGPAPNYYRSSYNGPVPCKDDNRPELIEIVEREPDNFAQVAWYWATQLTEEQRNRTITGVNKHVSTADEAIQEKVLELFYKVSDDMGERLEKAMLSTAK